MKTKRAPTQVHTRKLDRMVARKNMEKKGTTSFFAENWRSYVGV